MIHFTGVINIIKVIIIDTLPIDIELKNLTRDIKNYINDHSFYGKFCYVDISRRHDKYTTLEIRISMYPEIVTSELRHKMVIEYSSCHDIKDIKLGIWKVQFTDSMYRSFTQALDFNKDDIHQIIFNRIDMK